MRMVQMMSGLPTSAALCDAIRAEVALHAATSFGSAVKRFVLQGELARLVRLDKVSDMLFDLQRERWLMDEAASALYASSLPLKVDVIFPAAVAGKVYFQESIAYRGHFEHERAASLLLPISTRDRLMFMAGSTPSLTFDALGDPDFACMAPQPDITDGLRTVSLPAGQLVSCPPDMVFGLPASDYLTDDILLVFGYRSSRYRDWLACGELP